MILVMIYLYHSIMYIRKLRFKYIITEIETDLEVMYSPS